MITNINEAKTLLKHIHVIINANSIVQHVIQITNGIMMNANASVRSIACAIKIIVEISTCICENSRYFKSIADASVTICDNIISIRNSISINVTNNLPKNAANTVPTKVACTMSTNATTTVPINSDDKNVKYKIGLLYFALDLISDNTTSYN